MFSLHKYPISSLLEIKLGTRLVKKVTNHRFNHKSHQLTMKVWRNYFQKNSSFLNNINKLVSKTYSEGLLSFLLYFYCLWLCFNLKCAALLWLLWFFSFHSLKLPAFTWFVFFFEPLLLLTYYWISMAPVIHFTLFVEMT